MAFDHIGISVTDFHASKVFYTKALEPLGLAIVKEGDGWVTLGKSGRHQFSFSAVRIGDLPGPIHVAFAADTREQVREFYKAALAAGGKDNGPPGIREHYHPNYYGAFVIGPDGHNIEAVCRLNEA